jgi:hypothetical protein
MTSERVYPRTKHAANTANLGCEYRPIFLDTREPFALFYDDDAVGLRSIAAGQKKQKSSNSPNLLLPFPWHSQSHEPHPLVSTL